VARLLFPLLLYSVLVSTLFDWAARAVARQRGLGSLISSGRGMGATLGVMMTIFMIVDLGLGILVKESGADMLSDFGALLALVLFLSVVALAMILVTAQIAERWSQHYTIGFYWGFLALGLLMVVLTFLSWPCGIGGVGFIGPICD